MAKPLLSRLQKLERQSDNDSAPHIVMPLAVQAPPRERVVEPLTNPDVFVSYTRSDEALARQFVSSLEARRLVVWWDRYLVAGDDIESSIRRFIGRANAVVVIWTPTSVGRPYVVGEAGLGLASNKLIPVRSPQLEITKLPLGFGHLETRPISDIDGIVVAIHRLRNEIGG